MTDPVRALRDAADRYRAATERVDDVGRDRLDTLRDHLARFRDLLDAYEERASGSGRETFEAYVEFQGELESLVSDLPEHLHRRDAFEAAEAALDKRRLTEADFDRARDRLDPAADAVARLDDQADARDAYRAARNDVAARKREVEDRLADREAVMAFADVDLDADVTRLRDPIMAYNDAVTDAFTDYLTDTPARDVLAFLDGVADAYPLVPVDPPPHDLTSYLREHPAGAEPVPRLLEWTGYSRSKLDHYVDDPGAFLATVGANRTALDRIDPDPFTVAWPPPPADDLEWRARELVRVVDRFAPDAVAARLHDLRDTAREPAYTRLREAARAREELTDPDREALRDGSLRDEIEDLRDERDRLADALTDHSSP